MQTNQKISKYKRLQKNYEELHNKIFVSLNVISSVQLT